MLLGLRRRGLLWRQLRLTMKVTVPTEDQLVMPEAHRS